MKRSYLRQWERRVVMGSRFLTIMAIVGALAGSLLMFGLSLTVLSRLTVMSLSPPLNLAFALYFVQLHPKPPRDGGDTIDRSERK